MPRRRQWRSESEPVTARPGSHSRRAASRRSVSEPPPRAGAARGPRPESGQRGVAGVDQLLLAQEIQDRAPVAIAEGMHDDAVVLQQQGDRAVLGAVTRRGDVGAATAVVEVAPQRLHD